VLRKDITTENARRRREENINPATKDVIPAAAKRRAGIKRSIWKYYISASAVKIKSFHGLEGAPQEHDGLR
jgi:hypothetical protein